MSGAQAFKVAVLGCSGIGRLVSTVVRQAVYMIEKDRPDEVVVVGSGPLTGNVPEALEAARKHPLIVIDGCRPRCATAIAKGKDLNLVESVWVAEVAAKQRLSIAGEQREELGEKGMALARAVADEAIAKIDLINAEEAMSTL
jgi:uncharacterized metal-binding protein